MTVHRVCTEKYSKKFHKIYKKTPAMKTFLNKVVNLSLLLKKVPTAGALRCILQNFSKLLF